MAKRARAVVLVIDGGGVGASKDAADYQDPAWANTLANTARAAGGLHLPQLERLGLGCITAISGVERVATPLATCAALRELSNGKDSVTGHWEMMGIVIRNAFPTYPRGFPPDLIERFEGRIGRTILGNEVASGTEIIERLGAAHMDSGRPIVYTSADSVFQVATHEEVVPLQTLWEWCAIAREILVPPHRVNRVIARPFSGRPGSFYRTAGRRDYAVAPPSPSLLECLSDAGVPTLGLGKIQDIYSCKGVAAGTRTADNDEGLAKTIEWLDRNEAGFCFTNLNDFDSKYGHRRDADGFGAALLALDHRLPDLLNRLGEGDRCIITADHGCDPTAPGTDHTRELVPLLDYHVGTPANVLGEVDSFAAVGLRVLETFGLQPTRKSPTV